MSPLEVAQADPVDPVVNQRGHLATPVGFQAQAEQIGFGDLEQPGRADADREQIALLTTPDAFEPKDRAPLLDPAKVAAAARTSPGSGLDVEDVDMPGHDPPDRPGVVQREWLVARGLDHLTNKARASPRSAGRSARSSRLPWPRPV